MFAMYLLIRNIAYLLGGGLRRDIEQVARLNEAMRHDQQSLTQATIRLTSATTAVLNSQAALSQSQGYIMQGQKQLIDKLAEAFDGFNRLKKDVADTQTALSAMKAASLKSEPVDLTEQVDTVQKFIDGFKSMTDSMEGVADVHDAIKTEGVPAQSDTSEVPDHVEQNTGITPEVASSEPLSGAPGSANALGITDVPAPKDPASRTGDPAGTTTDAAPPTGGSGPSDTNPAEPAVLPGGTPATEAAQPDRPTGVDTNDTTTEPGVGPIVKDGLAAMEAGDRLPPGQTAPELNADNPNTPRGSEDLGASTTHVDTTDLTPGTDDKPDVPQGAPAGTSVLSDGTVAVPPVGDDPEAGD